MRVIGEFSPHAFVNLFRDLLAPPKKLGQNLLLFWRDITWLDTPLFSPCTVRSLGSWNELDFLVGHCLIILTKISNRLYSFTHVKVKMANFYLVAYNSVLAAGYEIFGTRHTKFILFLQCRSEICFKTAVLSRKYPQTKFFYISGGHLCCT